MKKQLIFLVLATALLTFNSCKKSYVCTCTFGTSNVVDWTGDVEAISKAKAISTVQADCGSGDAVTCN